VERYLKRYFWTIPLVLAVVCAVLAVSGVRHVLAARSLTPTTVVPDTSTTARVRKKARPAALAPSKDDGIVVSRNLFCSSCNPPAAPVAPTGPAAPVDPNAPPPTTALPLSLLATSVVDGDDDLSTATIAHTALARSGSYRVHDDITDAGDVVAIRPKWVDLHNDQANRIERLYLVGVSAPPPPAPPPPPEAAPPPPVASTPPAGGDDLMAAIDRGVQKSSETQYNIDRALVTRILADPTPIMRGGRLGPYIKDGKPLGFKFYSVRANSAYAKIGLQTGDVLQSINGFEITSPDKALEVYTKLKSATSLSMNILRNDQPMTLNYTIR
jgi:general secretion pathway protein C